MGMRRRGGYMMWATKSLTAREKQLKRIRRAILGVGEFIDNVYYMIK
jgi:hypothetical protein